MKTGILGGSFDPIHEAHISLARVAQELFGLDRVIFMLSPRPPHKQDRLQADSYHRYAMVSLALRHEDRMLASTLELRRSGPSYTVETLEEWGRLHPQEEFCFLAGADSLLQIHVWKDCDRLLANYSFVFVGRRGVNIQLENLSLAPQLKSRIQVCETPQPHLKPGQSYLIPSSLPPPASSSAIRSAVKRREEPEFLDPVVWAYIRKHRLYE